MYIYDKSHSIIFKIRTFIGNLADLLKMHILVH